jgi:hypothetical protein
MADLTGMMQAAAGAAGGGGKLHCVVAHNASPYFTLLDHTTPGTVSLATTYTVKFTGYWPRAFSPLGDYIAIGT